MRTVYECDFCGKRFESTKMCAQHEIICGRNPKNKITDKLLIKASELLTDFEDVLSIAISEVCGNEIEEMKKDAERAGTDNCPFTVYERKYVLKNVLIKAERANHKLHGLKGTEKDFWRRRYQYLIDAVKKELGNDKS